MRMLEQHVRASANVSVCGVCMCKCKCSYYLGLRDHGVSLHPRLLYCCDRLTVVLVNKSYPRLVK